MTAFPRGSVLLVTAEPRFRLLSMRSESCQLFGRIGSDGAICKKDDYAAATNDLDIRDIVRVSHMKIMPRKKGLSIGKLELTTSIPITGNALAWQS